MIHAFLCDALAIMHPVVLGGMGSGATSPLVAAVSNAGGLGTLGTAGASGARITAAAKAIRDETDEPFAINHLLFRMDEESCAATPAARPAVVAFAWARKDQDLRGCFERAHDEGTNVVYMAGEVPEALRAVEAGADFLAAHGSEAGGHVGWMATMVIGPLIVRVVAPVPVLAAGGVADGRGLAAALALGAEGALLGRRFPATSESPLRDDFMRTIVRSDGHDTVVTEAHDIAAVEVWPGAVAPAEKRLRGALDREERGAAPGSDRNGESSRRGAPLRRCRRCVAHVRPGCQPDRPGPADRRCHQRYDQRSECLHPHRSESCGELVGIAPCRCTVQRLPRWQTRSSS
ncbi:MAG: nitronate monooxygenase [Burkholderiales bacterium]|nr:nitronate monooxygenase [Burkholderiales bacterium]